MREQDARVEERRVARAPRRARRASAGPSRSSSSPSTVRGGPPVRPAERRARSTPSASRAPRSAPASATRVRARASAGPRRRSGPRPAAPRAGRAASAADRGEPVADAPRSRRASGRGAGQPGSAGEQQHVERRVDVDREPPPAPSRGPGCRRPPRASAAARCRTAGRGRPRERPRAARAIATVGRVAMVRERPGPSAAAAARRTPGGPGVASGIAPEPRTTRPPAGSRDPRAAGAARRTGIVGRLAADDDRRPRRPPGTRAGGARRARSAPRPARRASGPAPAGPAGGEDEDGDGRIRPSLATGGARAVARVGRTSGSARTSAMPPATLAAAVRALAALPGARLRGVSRLYATAPVGVVDQPEFRNAVAALDVPRGPTRRPAPSALLVALKDLERAFGRQPRERWGPREIDLDLLVFGRHGSTSSVRRRAERRPGEGRRCRSSSRTSRRATACSCSRRWPTSRRASCRPAGARRSRRPRATAGVAARGRRTPPARSRRWDGEGWTLVEPARARARVAGRLQPDGRRPVPVEHVDRVHEADLLGLVGHHQRVRPRAAAEEADALEQLARRSRRSPRTRGCSPPRGPRSGRPGPRRRGRASSAARSRSSSLRNRKRAWISPPRQRSAAAVITPSGAPPMPITRVDAGALDRARDRGRHVAVGDELDPGAGRADLGDQVLVARAVEDDDRDVADPRGGAPRRSGGTFSAGGRRMSTQPAATGPTASFSRYVSGALRQPAPLGRGEHGDRVRPGRSRRGWSPRAGRPRCRPAAIARRRRARPTCSPMYSIGASSRSPSPMTIVPRDVGLVHRPAHRLGRGPVGLVALAAAHEPRGRDRCGLGDADHLEREQLLHRARGSGRSAWAAHPRARSASGGSGGGP